MSLQLRYGGNQWTRQRVCFTSDNMAVVDLFYSQTSKRYFGDALILLCCLSLYAAFYQFNFDSRHIPGVQNVAAIAISCNHISLFLSLVLQATQVSIPAPVINLFITRIPDWGSLAWTSLLIAFLFKGSQNQPERCTAQVSFAECLVYICFRLQSTTKQHFLHTYH